MHTFKHLSIFTKIANRTKKTTTMKTFNKNVICGLGFLMIFLINPLFLKSQEKTNRLTLEDVVYIAKQQSPDALMAKHRFRQSYWVYKTIWVITIQYCIQKGTLCRLLKSLLTQTLKTWLTNLKQLWSKWKVMVSIRRLWTVGLNKPV